MESCLVFNGRANGKRVGQPNFFPGDFSSREVKTTAMRPFKDRNGWQPSGGFGGGSSVNLSCLRAAFRIKIVWLLKNMKDAPCNAPFIV